jgi:hypothetical protein
MNEIERKREARFQKAYERLGTTTPLCVKCNEDNPHCMELHHLAEHGLGKDTVIVCRNCHRKLTDKQKDHPLAGPQSINEGFGRCLLGIADLLELIIEKLREIGQFLMGSEYKRVAPGGSS